MAHRQLDSADKLIFKKLKWNHISKEKENAMKDAHVKKIVLSKFVIFKSTLFVDRSIDTENCCR